MFTWVLAALWGRLKRNDVHITPQHACLGYLLVAAGAASMFLAFYAMPIGTTRLTRGLIYLGKISFGLYVFHYFALMAAWKTFHQVFHRRDTFGVSVMVAFPLTIAAASVSYRFLEKPILRYKERFTFVQSRPV